MQSTTGPSSHARRRSTIPANGFWKMAPWDEFADDAAIESDFYLHRPVAGRGRRKDKTYHV